MDIDNIDFEFEAEASMDDLKRLLRCESFLVEYDEMSDAPFGVGNKRALMTMLDMADMDGFTVENCDNYAGHISFGKSNESDYIAILCHLDVVPPVGSWKYGPFNPTIEDGKLYCRGAADDKGPLMAVYYAMKILKNHSFIPSKEVRLIVGCDEESGSRCIKHYFTKHKYPTFAFSPDSSFPLIYGEKAILHFDIIGTVDNSNIVSFRSGTRYNIVPDIAELTVKHTCEDFVHEFKSNHGVSLNGNTYTFHGIASHGSTPEHGVNAVQIMFEFMDRYYPCGIARYITRYYDTTGVKQGLDIEDEEMGKLTINLGFADYDGTSVRLGYDMRVPSDDHIEAIQKRYVELLREFGDFKINNVQFEKRHYVDPNTAEVKLLMDIYKRVSGDFDAQPFTIGGGTYAKYIPNAVGFGPKFVTREDMCHKADEYIYFSDYVKWMKLYTCTIHDLTM